MRLGVCRVCPPSCATWKSYFLEVNPISSRTGRRVPDTFRIGLLYHALRQHIKRCHVCFPYTKSACTKCKAIMPPPPKGGKQFWVPKKLRALKKTGTFEETIPFGAVLIVKVPLPPRGLSASYGRDC